MPSRSRRPVRLLALAAAVAATAVSALTGCASAPIASESPAAVESAPAASPVREDAPCRNALSGLLTAAGLPSAAGAGEATAEVDDLTASAGSAFPADIVDPLAAAMSPDDCALSRVDETGHRTFYVLLTHGLPSSQLDALTERMGMQLRRDDAGQREYGADSPVDLIVRTGDPTLAAAGLPDALVLALLSSEGAPPFGDPAAPAGGSEAALFDGTWCSGLDAGDCLIIQDGVDQTWGLAIDLVGETGGCVLGIEDGANVLVCPAGVATPGAGFTPSLGAPVADDPSRDRLWVYNGVDPVTWFRQA